MFQAWSNGHTGSMGQLEKQTLLVSITQSVECRPPSMAVTEILLTSRLAENAIIRLGFNKPY
jgi:Flp pilus assembly CpaF family ATPase